MVLLKAISIHMEAVERNMRKTLIRMKFMQPYNYLIYREKNGIELFP